MALVRFTEKGHLVGRIKTTVADACKRLFPNDVSVWSVFEAENEAQESLIAAAYYLTLKRNHLADVWLVRFQPDDLAGIAEITTSNGDTEIARVDELHRDLKAEYNDVVTLIKRTFEGIDRGEGRLRFVSERELAARLAEIAEMGDGSATPRARKYANNARGA